MLQVKVLILVVVDNGLVLMTSVKAIVSGVQVLILVVVDNGLVPNGSNNMSLRNASLNPCCSGQWSSTFLM